MPKGASMTCSSASLPLLLDARTIFIASQALALGQGLLLQLHQLANAFFGQRQHAVAHRMRPGRADEDAVRAQANSCETSVLDQHAVQTLELAQ